MDKFINELQERLNALSNEEEAARRKLAKITEEKSLVERLLAVNGMQATVPKNEKFEPSSEGNTLKSGGMQNDYATLAREWITQVPLNQDCTTSEFAKWLRQKLGINQHDRNAVGYAFNALKKERLIVLAKACSGRAPHIYRRISATQE